MSYQHPGHRSRPRCRSQNNAHAHASVHARRPADQSVHCHPVTGNSSVVAGHAPTMTFWCGTLEASKQQAKTQRIDVRSAHTDVVLGQATATNQHSRPGIAVNRAVTAAARHGRAGYLEDRLNIKHRDVGDGAGETNQRKRYRTARQTGHSARRSNYYGDGDGPRGPSIVTPVCF